MININFLKNMIMKENIIIEKTDLDFSCCKAEKPLILDRDVSVLILPSLTQNDAFHNGTLEIFSYLQEEIGESDVELFASDDEYQELVLHSKSYWLGVFLVTQMAVPTFVNVMSDYISNKLQAKNGDEIELSVIIDKKDGRNIQVTYRGDAEHINHVLDKVNELSREYEIDKVNK
jgi:hypothetical protein